MFDDIFANFHNPFEYGHHADTTADFPFFADSNADWATHSTWATPTDVCTVEIGDPVSDAAHWHHQEGNSSCAIVAQASVYESITGQPLSEADACHIAETYQFFDPQTGTAPADMGKLLEVMGIPTYQCHDATLVDIATALENGDKVIVGLDAKEIWYPTYDTTGAPIEQPNEGHAVWVTGIDQKEDGSIKIIVNDSGTSNGQMMEIDAQDFLNAWGDYGNFMVVADAPAAPASV